jgi:LPS-assembly protein
LEETAPWPHGASADHKVDLLMRFADLFGLAACRGPGPRARFAPQVKLLAIVGAALVAILTPLPANAQFGGPKNPEALPDDGLGPRDVMIQADTLIDDRDNNTVTAEGRVEARMQGRTLRADKLVYNRINGAVDAIGHVVVVNADGTSDYGSEMIMDDQFRAALAYGFSMREQDNITLTAGVAVRRNETIDQLNNAVYTACNICAKSGAPKNPTWSIQATRIIQDRERHVIYYQNFLVRILGVPLFYSPVFWHPDPTAPRQSGFLTPKATYGQRRGFSYEQPYLFAVNPSTDVVVSPQINTRVLPLLNLEWVQRFYSGMVDVRAGYTNESDFDNHHFYGTPSSRSYVLGQGLFNIDPYTSWGFGLERVGDPTFFQRYTTPEVYEDRGPFPTTTNHLISQVYVRRQDDDTFLSVAAMDFQNLTVFGRNTTVGQPNYGSLISENSKGFPFVGPLVEGHYNPSEPVFGGMLSLSTSGVVLTRNDEVVSINDPTSVQAPGAQQFQAVSKTNAGSIANIAATAALTKNNAVTALTYTDYRRASAQADWNRTFTLDMGIRVQPFVQARGDAFSVSDSTLYTFGVTPTTLAVKSNETLQTYGGAYSIGTPGHDSIFRGLAQAGANISWPFIRDFGPASVILEPMAQVVVAPLLGVNPYIPNEDSVSFEYDETNLFALNRFPGSDLVESGQRLNLGVRATADWGGGHEVSFVVGRTFRAEPDPAFDTASGLAGTSSDWVTAVNFTPVDWFTAFTRERLDADTFTIRRSDTGVNFGFGRDSVSLRYSYNISGYQIAAEPGGVVNGVTLPLNYVSTISPTEDASISGQVFLTEHWGIGAVVSRDLEENIFPFEQFDLIYQDDCLRLDVLYNHNQTFGTVIGTSNAITFRITLSTLGGTPAATNRGGTR